MVAHQDGVIGALREGAHAVEPAGRDQPVVHRRPLPVDHPIGKAARQIENAGRIVDQRPVANDGRAVGSLGARRQPGKGDGGKA